MTIYGMIFTKIYIVATKINVALKFLDLSAKYSIFLIKTKKYCYSYLSLLHECIFFCMYVDLAVIFNVSVHIFSF